MAELTVIIPSYNMQEGALKAINSVLDQNMDVEIILVDDCSAPPITLPSSLLSAINIRVFHLPENSGPAHARNIGVQSSTTPWISFLDSDDVLLPNTLSKRLQFAITNDAITPENELHLYGCGWLEHNRKDKIWSSRIPRPATTKQQMASGCWYCPGSCIIAKRGLFLEHSFDEKIRRLEDYDLGLRLGLAGVKLSIDPVSGVKIVPNGAANAKIIDDCVTYILSKYNKLQKTDRDLWSIMSAYMLLEQSSAHFRESNFLTAAKYLLKSFLHVPRVTRHLSPGWTYKEN